MKTKVWLSTQIKLYDNPFKLAFSITGSEIQKKWFILISLSHENRFDDMFYQGQSFPTKAEMISDLNVMLRTAVYNCEKVSEHVDNVAPGDNGRYLTFKMIEKIISDLQVGDAWSLHTGTKDFKKKFLVKEDGLVEGQKILLTYLSGEKTGNTIERVLGRDVNPTFMFDFEKELLEMNVVQVIEKQGDGSFLVKTTDFDCSIVIAEK